MVSFLIIILIATALIASLSTKMAIVEWYYKDYFACFIGISMAVIALMCMIDCLTSLKILIGGLN